VLSTSVVVTCGASGCDTDGTAEREDSAVDGVRWDDAVQSASAPVAFLIVIVLLTPAGAVAPQGMALNTIHGVSDLLAGILPLVSRVVEHSPTVFFSMMAKLRYTVSGGSAGNGQNEGST